MDVGAESLAVTAVAAALTAPVLDDVVGILGAAACVPDAGATVVGVD